MRVVLCPGSFDPVTNGHLDIIGRAARLCDRCLATIFTNSEKSPLFSSEERREMLVASTARFKNVSVDVYDGLLSDYVRAKGVTAVVKGLRAVSDFEYEFQMAQMNRHLDGDLETLFIMTSPAFSYLSSSILKEVARLGGDIAGLVPPEVEAHLRRKYGRA